MNLVEATLESANGDVVASIGSQRLSLGDETLAARPAIRSYAGRTVVLGIRPEDFEDASLAEETPAERRLRGHVRLREALGAEIMVHFVVDAKPAVTDDVRELAQDVGDERAVEELESAEDNEAVLVGRFGARTSVREGEAAEIAVDTRALHFFDPQTGVGIYDDKEPTKGASS
jgi:multiple sugar transport system ATP-binding protein